MGKWFAGGWRCVAAIICLLFLAGCGGHKPVGPSVLPGKITLSPAVSASVQLGNTIAFAAIAQNASGGSVGANFTFTSSDTSVLNIAPSGTSSAVGCAGTWNATFTVCTPQNSGAVWVTATADGVNSPPTLVFVHPPVDSVTVTGILLQGSNVPIQEPCLPQGQTMSLQANAYSQGVDVTSSVGPFTWSVQNTTVATVVPTINLTYNVATNLATATAVNPGLTQIYATNNGVTSSTFYQPVEPGNNPAIFNFFETCPIQNIALEVGSAITPPPGITTFSTNKGTPQNVTAIVTDVLGNSSLTNNRNGVTLTKIPLTWNASQPGAIGTTASSCTALTCSLTITSPGSGTVEASCTPPTCNAGYPEIPAILNSTTACTQYTPPSCRPFIPLPVYATTAVSGLVTGATSATSVLASSFDCAGEYLCETDLYDISTTKNIAGSPLGWPAAPNSFLFAPNPGTARAYMGSEFGTYSVNTTNLGTATGAFTPLGAQTGKVLAVSPNGNVAVFSDTVHTPNQVYVVDTTNSSTPNVVALNISNATAAGFSSDGFKIYIYGLDTNGNPAVLIYSALLALQEIPVPAGTTVDAFAFSPNGAFSYVVSSTASSGTVNAYNVCDNSLSASVSSLPVPSIVQVIPNVHLNGVDENGAVFPDGVHMILMDTSGFEVLTSQNASPATGTLTTPGTICPQTSSFSPAQRVNLQQGTFKPINFFLSPDGSLMYIIADNLSFVMVYSFNTNTVTAIPLAGNATPVTGGMTIDGTLVYVAGSDGQLHEITISPGVDLNQIPFPPTIDFENPFCNMTPANGQPCTLDFVSVKP
jgi:hypothetical protein